MDKTQRIIRIIFFSVWAVFMTGVTYVLGAPSLKVLRRRLGRLPYWALTLLMVAGLFAVHSKFLALSFLTLVMLMGVFEEFEDMGFSFQASTFYTVLINALLSAGGFALWVSRTGPAWKQSLSGAIEDLIKPLTSMSPNFRVDVMEIMVQLPSIVMIMWLIAIYVAVVLEARMSGGEVVPIATTSVPLRTQLAAFRLPDVTIWIFILSLLGSFGNFKAPALELVAVNAMNVCMVLFFFQGIAVVGRLFAAVRMSAFWQTLFMIVIVLQLFLFVSLLGLLDYWLDFRTRLAKRAERFNREA